MKNIYFFSGSETFKHNYWNNKTIFVYSKKVREANITGINFFMERIFLITTRDIPNFDGK